MSKIRAPVGADLFVFSAGAGSFWVRSRGKDKVSEADILQAERLCSADALVDLRFELKDVAAQFEGIPDAFQGAHLPLSRDEVNEMLRSSGFGAAEADRAIELLVWFGFLGYWSGPDAERFSHQYQHDLRKMEAGLALQRTYTVHRAFRSALECIEPE